MSWARRVPIRCGGRARFLTLCSIEFAGEQMSLVLRVLEGNWQLGLRASQVEPHRPAHLSTAWSPQTAAAS